MYRDMFGPVGTDGSRAIIVDSETLRDAANDLIYSMNKLVKALAYLAVEVPIMKKYARALEEAFPHAYYLFESIWEERSKTYVKPKLSKYQTRPKQRVRRV